MLTLTYIALVALLACIFLCLYRIAMGPTAADRVVAIDILGTVIVGFCCVIVLQGGRDFYMNVAISWALLSFIGTIALAKYLEGKAFDE
jgi:multicomponent Na+:H+ antiporter subunit F